ncbi:MAG: dTDP-glucose 4,6-dehydratase [Alphaproteobacteria bacterium]
MIEPTARFLVTGGAGFIGSALVEALIGAGVGVTTVDKLSYAGNLANLAALDGHPRHHFIRADIADSAAMRQAFAEARPDRVFHLAAESHVDRSIDGPLAAVATNVDGTAVLLEEATRHWRSLDTTARDAFRFVHVSTDEVFGELGPQGRFDESSPYRPSSPYAATKAAADHLARAWHRTYGLPVTISNGSNTYGPRQHPEKLIPHLLWRASSGGTLPVYGRGENVRDWIHVSDHVAALLAICERGRPGETYVVGARDERRNIDVVQALCAALDRLAPSGAPHSRHIAFVADRPGHDSRYALDPAKIERELGWRPTTAFKSGLDATVAWYLEHGDWWDALGYDGTRRGLAQTAP